MTGHGRGEASDEKLRVVAEIHSVNRKQLDIQIGLPKGFDALEHPLRKQMSAHVSRGRISVRFYVHDLSGEVISLNLNQEVAQKYLKQAQELARNTGLESDIRVAEIIRLPGIFEQAQGDLDPDNFVDVFSRALNAALDPFLISRALEGEHMKEVLKAAVAKLQDFATEVRQRAPLVQEYHRKQLLERIERAGVSPESIDPNRLAQEIVLIADRCDVSEELDRLESHFSKFTHISESKDSHGRALDFLAQEMFREINTTGSKANDAGLSHLVVQMKTELEKFREQVQNIE